MIEYKVGDVVYITVNEKKVLKLDWSKVKKVNLRQRHDILISQFIYKSPKKVEYLFRTSVYERICKYVSSRMKTSYTDIDSFIISYYNLLDGAIPLFGQMNDHDAYYACIKSACDKEIAAYERSRGKNCWEGTDFVYGL